MPASLTVPESIRVAVASGAVTALRYLAAAPATPFTLVLGHGAGAPQTSDFMVDFASALAQRGISTVTFNFPYMEEGRRLPDRAPILEACFRAVIEAVRARAVAGQSRLVIGGKSLGGRMASHVAAAGLDGLAGLVFLGYPLHPPGQPEKLRAAHLARIREPMLFVQGARDAFGTPEELAPILAPLGPSVRVHVVADGDHSFKVPKRGPVSQPEVFAQVQDEIARWLGGL
ncbi:MAG TPA: alpha/beta family hydrolase [Methylomirabilota bacterium]|nr:alpha/beta family hydrolase [Methylomirabilota bacterium]